MDRFLVFHNTVQASIAEIKTRQIYYPQEIIKHLMKFWGVFYDDFEYSYTIDETSLNEHDKMRVCFQRHVIIVVEFVMVKIY